MCLHPNPIPLSQKKRHVWKYLLSLPLEDSGFDFSVLSEFRSRLLTGGKSEQLLGKLLDSCQRGISRTLSTRAGVEGTISQGVGFFSVRHFR